MDPINTKAVYLLGRIPVPYSGFINPDSHPDHEGAWPPGAAHHAHRCDEAEGYITAGEGFQGAGAEAGAGGVVERGRRRRQRPPLDDEAH